MRLRNSKILAIERNCAQGVELTLGAAEGDDECKMQPLTSMTPQETLLRCESGAAQFASLPRRGLTIRVP